MRHSLAIAILLGIGGIFWANHFARQEESQSGNKTADPRPKIERNSQHKDRGQNAGRTRSAEEILALVYERYPDLRPDYDIHQLPTESPLTRFIDWKAEHYPHGVAIPKELRGFMSEDFEWTESRLALAAQFMETHAPLIEALYELGSESPITTAPNFSPFISSQLSKISPFVQMLELMQRTGNDTLSGSSNAGQIITGLALHRLPTASEGLISNSMLERALKLPGSSAQYVTPSFDQQTAHAIAAAKNELQFVAEHVHEHPLAIRFMDSVSYEQRTASEEIKGNPEEFMLAFAAATQAQLDAFQTAADQGRRLSRYELDEIFTQTATELVGAAQASILRRGVLGELSQSHTRLALTYDEVVTQEALFQATADGVQVSSINDLVPNYLKNVPINRETGEEFTYDAETGQIVIPTDLRKSSVRRAQRP